LPLWNFNGFFDGIYPWWLFQTHTWFWYFNNED